MAPDQDELTSEVQVVWVDGHHPEMVGHYVRESTRLLPFRRRRPGRRRHPGRMVAYSTLRPDAEALQAPGGWLGFRRRIWWLAGHDPYDEGSPVEGVDPCSIRPGHPSRKPRGK